MRGRTVLFGDVLSALISTFQRKSSLLPMGKYIFTARMLSPSFNRAHPKQSLWRRSKSGLAFGWCARGPSSKAHHHKSRVLTWIWLDTINYCSIVIQRKLELIDEGRLSSLKTKTLAFLSLYLSDNISRFPCGSHIKSAMNLPGDFVLQNEGTFSISINTNIKSKL